MIVRLSALVCLGTAGLLAAPHTRAAVFCADSGAEIAGALAIAATNGEDDQVRIVSGSYTLASTLVHSTHEAFGLSISGRWDAICTAQSGSFSRLDGGGSQRILRINSDALSNLAIFDLYFSGGRSDSGGALLVETSGRNVSIERNLFLGNHSTGGAGAARIAVSTSSSLVVVRNNAFLGNSAVDGAGFVIDASIGNAYVNGNTVVGNTSTIAGATCGGLCIAGASAFHVSNNILWNNSGGDLHIGNTGEARLSYNDIGSMNGQAPALDLGNLAVDPGFAPGLLNLRLAPDSPLVNAGTYRAQGNIGDLDADRAPRLLGASVDIGAYETDVLLRDGFDAAPSTAQAMEYRPDN